MRRGKCKYPSLFFFGLTSILFLAFLTYAGGPQGETAKATKSAPAPGQATAAKVEYATSSTCAACHDDLVKKFLRNPHQALEIKTDSAWKDRACESCHGPGQAHIDAADGSQILSFTQSASKDINTRCLACHGRHPELV
jgi:hypothetical protein